ncbi:class I SAM-dependent methyltransferase [Parasphingorhabdus pacifica]
MTAQQDRPVGAIRKILDMPTLSPAAKLEEYRTFLSTAVRHPRMIGAATPTSTAVAATVAQVVPTTGTPVVVELGPGTGSLSEGIRGRLPSNARHVGIELSQELVDHLRTHKPWMEVVQGDAGRLREILDDLDIGQVDAIISSIPWSLLALEEQNDILRQVAGVMAPHSAFTAVTYIPVDQNSGGKRFRAQLDATFDEVLTHTTWRNLPPILHYICRRPLPGFSGEDVRSR